MPTPSTRTPVRIARGSYSNLNSSISDLGDGEICYAEDQDKLYVKEGSSLVSLTFSPASPTFTGTVTIPTPSANDNTTKAASTAYVQTELGDYLTTATAASTYAPLSGASFTGSITATYGTFFVSTGQAQVNVGSGNAGGAIVILDGDSNGDAAGGDYAFIKHDTSGDLLIAADNPNNDGEIKFYTSDGSTLALTLAGANATFAGDLTVNGTTTTINTQTLDVEDINITLGKVSTPTDTTADGGGITLLGSTSKTFNWVDSTDSWTSSENIEVAAGKFFKDDKGNLRSIPANTQSSAHVAVAADAGKAIYISTGGVTINNSVFSAGDAVTIINNSGSDQTITQGSGVTIHNSADAATGNRTLAARGMATIWFAAADTAYISGAGLS